MQRARIHPFISLQVPTKIRSTILLMIGASFSIACEDRISPTLQDAPALVVVDAWINTKIEPQIIRLTQSQPYFDNSVADLINGALVSIEDSEGTVYPFTEQTDGTYQWNPSNGVPFGHVGLSYILNIQTADATFTAQSAMNRVPLIDSVTFRFEEKNFILPDSYWAEFWSRDFAGIGDTYWIKSYKNGQFLNNPDEINIAFDAGFSEGGNIDGLLFIPPIRDAINPLDQDEDDEFLSPFDDGDEIVVEIFSITNEAFIFLNEMALQINRPGGFGELFATPLSNVPTNIVSSNPHETVVGFFNISAVTSSSKILDVNQVPR